MTTRNWMAAGLVAAMMALPGAAWAEMHAHDAYARFLPGAKSGAAFMVLENHTPEDDRLIGAFSRIAERVELHTHVDAGDGLMQMREVEGGIVVPGNSQHALTRGGDHLMFMGVTDTPPEGGTVPVTLVFEKAGELTFDIPVDNARTDAAEGGDEGHGAHKGHGTGG